MRTLRLAGPDGRMPSEARGAKQGAPAAREAVSCQDQRGGRSMTNSRTTGGLPFTGMLIACMALTFPGAASAALSQEEFRNPPLRARPSCLWSWLNGHVDHKQITRELEQMKAKGMRGAIIWDVGSIADPDRVIPAGPPFLGPESVRSIHHAMDEAERLGLELGLFASSSWNAGGTWITPRDGSKALRWSEITVRGPAEFSDALPLPDKVSKPYQEIAVLAVPDDAGRALAGSGRALRLDAHLDADGRLAWSVPSGAWRILRFVCDDTGEFLNCPSPNSRGLVIDHLSRQAADAHLAHILDALSEGRKGFGPLKCLMLDSYEVRPAVDWTPGFIEAFVAHTGYDPVPWLPVLAGWTVGGRETSERFLHDYRKTVSDLIIENHFAREREILNRRGLQLLAEAGHGGYARVDPLKALGATDIPMGEFWNHRKNWVTKEAASAAHIYGKTLVNAESFTGWQNWQDGPAAYKRLLDIALCAGLNQVTFHTFAHNPPEAGLPGFAYHAGEHFNVNATWWDQAGPMLADMARCCHMLQQGLPVADVCAYYGDEAPNLVPARRIAPTITSQWGTNFCAHCGRPKPVNLDSLGPGYDYDYINEEAILTRMQVREGRLVLPPCPAKPGEPIGDVVSYRLLVLPDRTAISPEVLRRIGELVEAGATVAGPRPARSNSLRGFPDCDRQVRELAARIWGDCDGDRVRSHAFGKGRVVWNIPLADVLAGMEVAADFVAENVVLADRHIDHIHRTTGDEEIYFVSNSSTNREVVRCRFRVGAGRSPSLWHAGDGAVTPCHAYTVDGGFTRVTLDLAPASSVFVVFAKDAGRDHLVRIDRTAASDAGAPAGDRPEIEVLAMTAGGVQARVWQPGVYRVQTAAGLTGKMVVEAVPADQAIEGPWRVTFEEGRGAPNEVAMPALADWTASSDPGVRHFSGHATYRVAFTLPDTASGGRTPVVLDLGAVKEVAVVRVNGREAGVLWKEPRRVDIARLVQSGRNQLEITVVNTWNNRLAGDARAAPEARITRTNLTRKFGGNAPLLPSGLLGPVSLKFPVPASCELQR